MIWYLSGNVDKYRHPTASTVSPPNETNALSDATTLAPTPPQPEKSPQVNQSPSTFLDTIRQRRADREEHAKLFIDQRIKERFVRWEKNFDAQLEWIENKCEDRINERTQQLKNLLDERTAELEWSLVALSKSLAANDHLSSALEETQREIHEIKRHINVPEKPKPEPYRRVNDPQREPFAKWRRNAATAKYRPLPINTEIASDHGKRMDLPLLTQSESPGPPVKSVETKSTSVEVTEAMLNPVEQGRRRERKRQREEEPSQAKQLVNKKGEASTEALVRPIIRRVRGSSDSMKTRSPPNKRAKVSENLVEKNTEMLKLAVGVREWVDIDLPECLDKDTDSPHLMILSPRRRKRTTRR